MRRIEVQRSVSTPLLGEAFLISAMICTAAPRARGLAATRWPASGRTASS